MLNFVAVDTETVTLEHKKLLFYLIYLLGEG